MLRAKYLLVLSVLLFINTTSAQDIRENFRHAGNLYIDEEYEKAYQQYQQILESGFESGELYYNLGNTSFRLKNRGEAILYYEKALKFLPGDPEITANLVLVRKTIVDRLEFPDQPFYLSWFDDLKRQMSTPEMDFIIILGMLLTSLFWSVWIVFRQRNFSPWLISLAIGITAVWLFLFAFWNLGNYDRGHEIRGVLLVERAEIRTQPQYGVETLFILHEGADFFVKRNTPDWVEIELMDGKTGWVDKKSIGII